MARSSKVWQMTATDRSFGRLGGAGGVRGLDNGVRNSNGDSESPHEQQPTQECRCRIDCELICHQDTALSGTPGPWYPVFNRLQMITNAGAVQQWPQRGFCARSFSMTALKPFRQKGIRFSHPSELRIFLTTLKRSLASSLNLTSSMVVSGAFCANWPRGSNGC